MPSASDASVRAEPAVGASVAAPELDEEWDEKWEDVFAWRFGSRVWNVGCG